MIKENDILITGGSGMVGHALERLIPNAVFISSSDFDLRSKAQTDSMFDKYQPKYVIHLAAKVGGVKANTDFVGEFFCDNIKINTNVLDASMRFGVTKTLSLLSTCIYPDSARFPLTEDQIHDGRPHVSNFGYAHAKRMLDVQSRAYRQQYGCNFITAVPNNLFGENDNFENENSHVIPAIMRKVYEANVTGEDVMLWGNGSALREFTYSHDIAKILLFLLEEYSGDEPVNIGNTNEFSIKEIAKLISHNFGYERELVWDISKPSGQLRKPSSNSNLLSLGWFDDEYTDFNIALENTCNWFKKNYSNARGIF